MSYTPDATVVTEPQDSQKASTAALEFRTLKAYIQTVIIPGLAGKANLSGAAFSGATGAIGDTALLYLARSTKSSGQNSLTFNGGSGAATWQIYQQTADDALRIFDSVRGVDVLVIPAASGITNVLSLVATESSVTAKNTLKAGLSGSGVGTIDLQAGDPTHTGYLEFYSPSAVRQGYIGFSGSSGASDAGAITFAMGNAGFSGNVSATAFYGDGSHLTGLSSAPVLSVNGRIGNVVISSGDVTDALGYVPSSAGVAPGTDVSFKDITATRGNGTGVIYLGDSSHYLYFDTATYQLPAGNLLVGGNVQASSYNGYIPYNSANPAGYIAGINSGMVTAALGYTPYNSSNPAGYITSAVGNLGYTPVQQGTGAGQLSNTVKIGWSGSGRLKVTVDSTDLGNVVFDSQLSNYAPLTGGGTSGTWPINIVGVSDHITNPGFNGYGVRTISTSAPSGTPGNGDIWYHIV